jgi:hypothetical protein
MEEDRGHGGERLGQLRPVGRKEGARPSKAKKEFFLISIFK